MGKDGGEDGEERRGAVGQSQTDFLAWAVCGVPPSEAVSPHQEGFSPWPPRPAHCPAPRLCPRLPLDAMLSMFLVLPLILFFKG